MNNGNAKKLIDTFLALYGEKFRKQFAGMSPSNLISVWEPLLASLTDEQIQKGLGACMTRPWPPTLPEFISLCKPDIDPSAAYYEAVQGLIARQSGLVGEWSHPAIFYAAAKMSADILSGSYQTRRAQWERELSAQLALGVWEPIPTPTLVLEAPQSAEGSAQQAAEIVRLVASAMKKKRDPMAWARQVLENPEGKAPEVIRRARVVVHEFGL